MRSLSFAVLTALLALSPIASAVQRRALLIGADTGWAQDQPLRHAREDARRLADTLIELGGFAERDVSMLEDPSTDEVRRELERLGRGVTPGDESVLVFFYSGHSDAKHLHLQGPPLALDELYHRLRELPSSVKIGILDACRSGSILSKGGRPTQSFEVKVQDELSVKGLALLASSGADELSQEARTLAGSFFSHHLVSGLRGAADEDGDRRVSLGEAYRYASLRTMLDTAATPAGVQRPAFRYELNGRGEIYLTKLEQSVGVLQFPPGSRRCFVTDVSERRLVAEVTSERARPVQLGLPGGTYVLKCPGLAQYEVAGAEVRAGATVDVGTLAFQSMPLSAGVLKGGSGRDEGENQFALKRQGFVELKAGRPDDALATFDRILRRDMRDAEAFRGKAQAYLALAEIAAARGQPKEEQRLFELALLTDPRLEGDPELASHSARRSTEVAKMKPKSPEEQQRDDEARAKRNLESGHPRRYQTWGVGLALVDGHGLLHLTVDRVILEKFQLGVALTFLAPGVGASLRVIPRDGPWSPFAGIGGQVGLPALGLGQSSVTSSYSVNGREFANQTTFDRLAFVDVGVQASTRHGQFDLGLAVLYSAPLEAEPRVLVLPVLAAKYFF